MRRIADIGPGHRVGIAVLWLAVATAWGSGVCAAALPPPSVSVERGFYDDAVQVVLQTPVAGTTIRYTIDGSPPGRQRGIVYTGPIVVDTTTILRAAVTHPAQDTSAVVTRTYLFLDEVTQQPAQVPGYNPPTLYKTTSIRERPVLHDNEMDPGITGHPVYGPLMREALTAIPSLSVAVDPDLVFGPRGFHDNLRQEVPASIEVLHPAAPERNQQVDAGIEGHASVKNKRAFRLRFSRDYGPPEWRTDLLQGSPLSGVSATDSFDRLVLRAGNNRSWAMSYAPPTYTLDQFYRETQLAMSGYGAHGVYVHLYINGLYWGLYNLAERPNEDFMSAYFGGPSDDWFSTNQNGIKNGSGNTWFHLHRDLAALDPREPGRLEEWSSLLDLDAFADYMILNWYIGQGDWPFNNWWAGARLDPPGPHRFVAWDGEFTWSHIGAFRPDGNGAFMRPDFASTSLVSDIPIYRLWHALRKSPGFMTRFHDRVYRHTTHDGVLTDAACQARFDVLNAWVELPVVAESARWGDALEPHGDPVRTRDVDWAGEVALVRSLMAGNTERFIEMLRDVCRFGICWYPDFDPPAFSLDGGPFEAGTTLALADPDPADPPRTIYYTLDGSDPRAPEGEPAPDALVYGAPIALVEGLTVRARLHDGRDWSALHEHRFGADDEPPAPLPELRVTELHYNPRGGSATFDNDDYEFLEIRNVGPESVGLGGVRFADGIEFTFADSAVTSVEPGATVLVVKSLAAFVERYGAGHPLAGEYGGQLSNGGERVELADAAGRTIHAFTYDDAWYPLTDGAGYSLVAVDPHAEPALFDRAEGWRASRLVHGSPGTDDPPVAELSISDATVLEGDWGLVDAVFEVTLPVPAGGPVEVGYVTEDAEAIAGEDYLPASGRLTLAPGQQSAFVTVAVRSDLAVEGNETFGVVMFGASGAGIARARGTGTILNDESLPPVPRLRVGELMYHPAPGSAKFSDDAYEFIEVVNPGTESVPLGGLRFGEGIAFDFAGSPIAELGPGRSVLVVKDTLAFAERYGPSAYPIAGEFEGQLDNGGEAVALQDAYGRPVHAFEYDDAWYPGTDGGGFSLVARDLDAAERRFSEARGWRQGRAFHGTPAFTELPGVVSPLPGTVYREITLVMQSGGSQPWRVTDEHSPTEGAARHLPNPVLAFDIPDGFLDHAVHAEFLVDYWGGHPGTSRPQARFNGHALLDLPELETIEPVDGEDRPECYMQQWNPVFTVPLDHLVAGENILEGKSGPQTCFSFQWAQWGWYAAKLRIYYDPAAVEHPFGFVGFPNPDGVIGEHPTLSVEVTDPANVLQVDFLARVDGYDFDGDGIYADFQQSYHRAKHQGALPLAHHAGTATAPPFEAILDTTHLPDQRPGSIQVMARILGADGVWYATRAVDGVTLARPDSVRLFRARNVPPRFWIREPRPSMSSEVFIPPDLNLAGVTSARLMIRTWNGEDGGWDGPRATRINDEALSGNYGGNHHYSADVRNVSPSWLIPGVNEVTLETDSHEHGIEVLWPGPAILVRSAGPGGPLCGDGVLDTMETCDDGNVTGGDGCEADCTLPGYCGDGHLDPGEGCDDGNNFSGDGCEGDCRIPATCGNGVPDPGEACDDGNATPYDGCEPDCRLTRSDDLDSIRLFVNGEGCNLPVCDDRSGYVLHPRREFSAGDRAGELKSAARISPGAALFGGYGFESPTSFDQLNFDVHQGDLVPGDAGTVCMVVREVAAASGGHRLLTAQAANASSYAWLDFAGRDDLQLRYRDADQVLTTLTTDWGGADAGDTMLIQLTWDARADRLRILVDGVPRAESTDPIAPLGPIELLTFGNRSNAAGHFRFDPVLTGASPVLDCWELLAGTCGDDGERCLEDADCPAASACLGVIADHDLLRPADLCPADPAKLEPGACGCGVPDADDDFDGVFDCNDVCLDIDRDGYGAPGGGGAECLGGDCDDLDALTHPAATEIVCDGVDNDCNVDTTDRPDLDGDGFACDADCNDGDPTVSPARPEILCDGVDNDCDAGTLDAGCDDGLFCNGVETCGVGVCLPGIDPCAGAFGCDEEADTCIVPVAQFESVTVTAGPDYRPVALQKEYLVPVVTCAVQYANNALPVVPRVRNVGAAGFEIRLQNPSGDAVVDDAVHCLVAEQGAWTIDGVRVEAFRYRSTVTDRAGSWRAEARNYGHTFTRPVVLGQVMTENNLAWSVFWSRGGLFTDPPSVAAFRTGKHVGQDTQPGRAAETVGVVVFEAGHGRLAGVEFEAGVGPDSVRGATGGPYPYVFTRPFAAAPTFAVVSQTGMDGSDGSWGQLHGATPATRDRLFVSVDEDQLADAERDHITEQLAYAAFAGAVLYPHCDDDAECDDGSFCNGVETCRDGTCTPGEPLSCDDGLRCTADSCDEASDTCLHEPVDAVCGNGRFCDGVETCDVDLGCVAGPPPCLRAETCDEVERSCGCRSDFECDDGIFCNGEEVCGAAGCRRGPAPCTGLFGCIEDEQECIVDPPLAIEARNAVAGGEFVTVALRHDYHRPVVACSVVYSANSVPVVVRVRNVTNATFDVRLQNPSGRPVVADPVQCLVVEEGVWRVGDVRFEAFRYESSITGGEVQWGGEQHAYGQAYASPVVVGQVMSQNDPRWSVFWNRGDSRAAPPSAATLIVGKHVGDDPDNVRAAETVGVIVFEAGSGRLGGVRYTAAVGPETVRGAGNSPPYPYLFPVPFDAAPGFGVVAQAGMNGGTGSWGQFHGPVPTTATELRLSVDETEIVDTGRSHLPEQVGYVIFESDLFFPAFLPDAVWGRPGR